MVIIAKLIVAAFQVLAICLMGQGGLVLSLAGFTENELVEIKQRLSAGFLGIAPDH